MTEAQEKYVEANGLNLHYLEFDGNGTPIILMHGLTANAAAFIDVAQLLSPRHHVISVDLRGRGLSDKPDSGYSMEEHARDIIDMVDALGYQKVVLGGHSFGALLTLYMASHYPDRVDKVILIDAAVRMHPDTRQMVEPALRRLGQKVDSFEAYIDKMKAAPYLIGKWDDSLIKYYRADVKKNEDGTVQSHSQPEHMIEAVDGALSENWIAFIKKVSQPGIMINATEPYGPPGAEPILPRELAMETVNAMENCHYFNVPGNHLTMLFKDGAARIAQVIEGFLKE